MSSSNCCSPTSKTTLAYLVGGVGSFLIVGVLAWLVVRQPVSSVDAERVSQRVKFRSEVEAASGPKVTGYALDT
ncbi:MAG: hypothetical protein RLZZ313_1100, partial [Verrucomicrobiota bacterium]